MWLRRLLTVLTTVALGIWFFVLPAQATVVFSCSNDSVCLYQWKNTTGPNGSGGRWQSSFNNINTHSGQCLNLTQPMAYWPNGDQVTDNSASLIINGIPGGGWGNGYSISFYNWANCNSGGGILGGYLMDSYQRFADLSQYEIGGGLNAYHVITSMKVWYNCPSGGC